MNGTLQTVNFVEGQSVHAGDVLAQIDPRLYQAALDEAKGKLAEDQAQLVSAQKDLERFRTLVTDSSKLARISITRSPWWANFRRRLRLIRRR